MLQQMRGLAKYIWVLVALVFVGGFLLYETSGLMGRTPVTPTTAVAVVNGREIPYRDYIARVQNEIQAAQQRERRTLSQDDNRRIENTIFDQMVNEVLLQSEYRRRGIVVTDDEVREFARYAHHRGSRTLPNYRPRDALTQRSINVSSRARRLARADCFFSWRRTTEARFRAKSCSTKWLPAST